jgi:hypothetical protein
VRQGDVRLANSSLHVSANGECMFDNADRLSGRH